MWSSEQLCAVLMLALIGCAQARANELVAPYVQTVMEDVELMLELGGAGPGDYVMDLGAGDGRIVITAAHRGALGQGIELDRELVELARARAREAGMDDRVAFVHGDVFSADLSAATLVTLYLMPDVNLRLRPKLLAELAPGTRVVSNSFDMGDWQPDRHVFGRSSGGIFLWIVPAPVQGRWRVTLDGATLDLSIEQAFQEIVIEASAGGAVTDSRLNGDRISFFVEDARRRYAFSGSVAGAAMDGLVHVHEDGVARVARWRARRVDAQVRS
jgi:hypothetical protein